MAIWLPLVAIGSTADTDPCISPTNRQAGSVGAETFFYRCLSAWSGAQQSAPSPNNQSPSHATSLSNDDDLPPQLTVWPSDTIRQSLTDCRQASALVYLLAHAQDDGDGSLTEHIQLLLPTGLTARAFGPGAYAVAAPVGKHLLTLTVTDSDGQLTRVDRVVIVEPWPGSGPQLGCRDTINVGINGDCQVLITPAMAGAGNWECLRESTWQVQVHDNKPANGPLLDGPGVFRYEIFPLTNTTWQGFTGPLAFDYWTVSAPTPPVVLPNHAQQQLDISLSGEDRSLLVKLPFAAAGRLSVRLSVLGQASLTAYRLTAAGSLQPALQLNAGQSVRINQDVQAGDYFLVHLTGIANTGLRISELALAPPANGQPVMPACWGHVRAVDRGAPIISCPPDTDSLRGERIVQTQTVVLGPDDPTFHPASLSCFQDIISPSAGPHPYRLLTFSVDRDDRYTFSLTGVDQSGLAALFQGDFYPAEPCRNIIARGDVTLRADQPTQPHPDPVFRLTLPLRAGQVYTLLTAGDEILTEEASFTWRVSSSRGGRIRQWPLSVEAFQTVLIGGDIDSLSVDNLAPQIPRCYALNAQGQLVLPTNQVEQLRLLRLLSQLGGTGYPGGGTVETEGAYGKNCGAVDICVQDRIERSGDCAPAILRRRFIIRDDFGATDSCEQRISVRPPTLADVILPPFTSFVECDEDYPRTPGGNPAPALTGYPFLRTAFGDFDLAPAYRSIGAGFEDGARVPYCGVGYRFMRRWNIIDWCNPGKSIIYNQVIVVGDYTAPEIDCRPTGNSYQFRGDTLVYGTLAGDCTAAFPLPVPQVTDNCNEWRLHTEIFTYNGDGSERLLAKVGPSATNRYVENIPPGLHYIRYIATDLCNNSADAVCPLLILDLTEPVAICKDELHVSLNSDGLAAIAAVDIDDHSWDNCALAGLSVRRPDLTNDTLWRDTVYFNCEDLNKKVKVSLRATDTAGLHNVCWAEILIEDKLPPRCVAPHDREIECNRLPAGFAAGDSVALQDLFGRATATDNCGAAVRELAPRVDQLVCGLGTIERRFQATDLVGNVSDVCVQRIRVTPVHDYAIRFPADGQIYCGDPAADTIAVYSSACDLLAVSLSEERLVASADECFKLRRVYRVLNWCEYDGESEPIRIGRDEDCDGLPGDEAVWVVRQPDTAYVDRDSLPGNLVPQAGESICGPGGANPAGYWRGTPSVGYWEYVQLIKVYDDVPPEVIYNEPFPFCAVDNETCLADVELRFIVQEECTPEDLKFEFYFDEFADGFIDEDLSGKGEFAGLYPKFLFRGRFPIGHHEVILIITDGCGNKTRARLPFTVVDCVVAVPPCIHGLTATLQAIPPGTDADGDGRTDAAAVVVWATDFIASPVTDCSGPLHYSINRVGEPVDSLQTSLVFTCADIPIQEVEIHAWDRAVNPYRRGPDGRLGSANYSYCRTYILVQDDNVYDFCPPISMNASVAGLITNVFHEPLAGVAVAVDDEEDAAAYTDKQGNYHIGHLPVGDAYTFQPQLADNARSGVSTFDIVLIAKHILGVERLKSPYQLIAADVNGSGSITALDIVQLRRLVLEQIDELPGGQSWRFLPTDFVFPDTTNPWLNGGFPQSMVIDPLLPSGYERADFIGVKLGDVNSTLAGFGQGVDPRSDAGVALPIELTEPTSGRYEIIIRLPEGDSWQGLQFGLTWEADRFLSAGLEPGLLDSTHFHLRDGKLLVSWTAAAPTEPSINEIPLLRLSLMGEKNLDLGKILKFDMSQISGEIYDAGDNIQPLYPRYDRLGEASLSPSLSAFPNPFSDRVQLRFGEKLSADARLEIIDYQGRLIKSIILDPMDGAAYSIASKELNGPGIYFFKLVAEGGTQVLPVILQ